MIRNGFDDVEGIVIGNQYIVGKLYYEDRQQGQEIHADTIDELIAMANEMVEEYKKEYCPIGLYLDANNWTLRIYE